MPTYCVDITVYNTIARCRGIGRYAYYLSQGLVGLQDELHSDERFLGVVKTSGEDALVTDLRLEFPSTRPLPAELDQSYSQYFVDRRRRLKPMLRELGADLVHFMEGPAALHQRAYRSMVTCHDLIPLRMPSEYLRTFGSRVQRRFSDYMAYHRAHRVVAISQATAKDLTEVLEVPPAHIDVVLQGVDHQAFHPEATASEASALRTEYDLPERYLLFVGAHDPRKRVALLIDAVARTYPKTGVPLVLLGHAEEPRQLARPEREAMARAPEGAVRLVGRVAEHALPAFYRQATAHMMPSIYEGFGLTLLEAMASGCPVVTTRCTSLPEVAGEAAIYVAKDSLTGLEGAIHEVCADSGLRERLREAGVARASLFSWEKAARATLASYRRACGVAS